MDKIETYIGFSVKKGSVVFGLDCLTRYRKKLYHVVVTQSVAEMQSNMPNNATFRLRWFLTMKFC